ncbi:hypothetical protein Tco_1454373, partial [Tanacetum coccineum]
VINSPCYHNKELASPEQTATAEVVPKSVAGSSFPAASSTLLPFNVQGRIVRNYEFLVPTGSTQFLLVVRFSLPGLLESPGLMESIKRHSKGPDIRQDPSGDQEGQGMGEGRNSPSGKIPYIDIKPDASEEK